MFFGQAQVQLSYNARLRRARIAFLAGECFRYRQPPLKLLQKMQQRFEEDKEDGHIEAYALFTHRLKELWAHVRSLEGQLDPAHTIRMTIGQGGRIYREIRLSPAEGDGLARLSCDFGDRRVPLIPFNAFVFNVILGLERLGCQAKVDRAQLRFLYLLLQSGQKLREVTLQTAPTGLDLPLTVRLDPQQKYATLHLFDHRWLRTPENREAIWKRAVRELNRLNKSHMRLHLLREHSLEKLASLASKMQGTGFNMPYDLLIAYEESYRFDVKRVQEEKTSLHESQEDLGRWRSGSQRKSRYFQVSVSADGMSAQLTAVNSKALGQLRESGGIKQPWLLGELAKLGIVHGTEDFAEALLTAIQKKQELVGLTVAAGTPSLLGETPYLHVLGLEGSRTEAGTQDMRENQNLSLVRRGQLIAEVRFKEGQPAITVKGQRVHVRGKALSQWKAGEGVRLEEEGRFYATQDGILSESEGVLQIEAAYIHDGSINLSSGNLSFDGSVVVRGDIEAGATVRVRGQLLVEGMIAHAKVQVKGQLEVKGGIITGPSGRVEVEGDLRCNFIEHSEVQVRGDLHVKRSLLNSHIVAGGAILLKDSKRGTISGGVLSSSRLIRTAVLGSAQGSSTECRIGGDFDTAVRLRHARARIQSLSALQKKIDEALQTESESKEPVRETIEQHKLRLAKVERILERAHRRCSTYEQRMKWNLDACLFVSRYLDKSSILIAGAQRVPLSSNLSSAIVTGHAFQGRHLLDPDELGAFQAAHPEIDLLALKKAV